MVKNTQRRIKKTQLEKMSKKNLSLHCSNIAQLKTKIKITTTPNDFFYITFFVFLVHKCNYYFPCLVLSKKSKTEKYQLIL